MTASTAAGEAAGVPLRSTAGRFGAVARDLIVVGLVAGVGLVAVVGYTTFRIWQIGATDGARPAGAIVVLGAAQYDGRPSPVFEARLEHAVDLWQAGLAPLLVMTGGKQPGDRVTEAEAGRDYALSRGVPESAIVVEPASRSTLASVEAVRELLARRGVDDAVFVSDPTHMLRVLRMAGDAGFQAYGSPTRTSPAEARLEPRLRSMVHELGALALYFIAGQAPSGESTAD